MTGRGEAPKTGRTEVGIDHRRRCRKVRLIGPLIAQNAISEQDQIKPPQNADPSLRACFHIRRGKVDRINLCQNKWTMREARRGAAAIRTHRVPLILLGSKVAAAFEFRPWEPWTIQDGGKTLLRIHTPLAKLDKAGIVKLAAEVGVDFAQTHSCYDPDPAGHPCGRCDSCLLRKKGFREAGVTDPVPYVIP